MKEEIISALREVYDPEIPINVYDLGLIYNIDIREDSSVHILMTLTSPTCPTAEYIQTMVREAVEGLNGVLSVQVELTFDPPWTPDRVSIEAKEELGLESSPKDPALSNTFQDSNSKNVIPSKICFNCGAGHRDFPIIACHFKGEDTYICSRCISKI